MAPLNLSLRALCMPITSATGSRRPRRLLTRPSRSRALSPTHSRASHRAALRLSSWRSSSACSPLSCSAAGCGRLRPIRRHHHDGCLPSRALVCSLRSMASCKVLGPSAWSKGSGRWWHFGAGGWGNDDSDFNDHLPKLWNCKGGNHANGRLPVFLQMHRVRRDAETEAGRLLRVLLLRRCTLSADTGSRKNRLAFLLLSGPGHTGRPDAR
jgi:hypothetical protein